MTHGVQRPFVGCRCAGIIVCAFGLSRQDEKRVEQVLAAELQE